MISSAAPQRGNGRRVIETSRGDPRTLGTYPEAAVTRASGALPVAGAAADRDAALADLSGPHDLDTHAQPELTEVRSAAERCGCGEPLRRSPSSMRRRVGQPARAGGGGMPLAPASWSGLGL